MFIKRNILLLILLVTSLSSLCLMIIIHNPLRAKNVLTAETVDLYWLVLHRKSNTEELFKGIPGDKKSSHLIKTFKVKTGIPGERPTPLPQLVGRQYWLITEKHEEPDNPETAPYFLTLNVPVAEEEPYGPVPYNECDGQCNWILPGAFGLHGIAGNSDKISPENAGSSGCIRHTDEDIAFLYKVLDPISSEIRYYIQDN